MHLPKEQKENQRQEKTTEMRMCSRASEQQEAGQPRVRAIDAIRYLQDAGHGAPPALLPPSSGRLGQGQSRRQAGGWYRCRTAPAHIPADPNKGTAVRAARAQALPSGSWARPRSCPLASGLRGPAPRSRAIPWRLRLPLGTCYFSSFFFCKLLSVHRI